jgi:hypothetical protein
MGCLINCTLTLIIIYFYRIRSRDAAGRLTGHIVGNGLSTEQDFSPASGHLYTIKSNFNSVDEIRNLEYEYDLMDNVTQRQNHISGLMPMGCFLGCLLSLPYKDFCIIIIFISYLIDQYLPFFTLGI